MIPGEQELELIEPTFTPPKLAESRIDNIAREMYTEKNIQLKTELTVPQIMGLTKCAFLADRFGIEMLRPLMVNLNTHLVSKDRKGRIEYKDMVVADMQAKKKKNALRKLLGVKEEGAEAKE